MKRSIFILILVSLLLVGNVMLFKAWKRADNELGMEKNNRIAYEQIVSGITDEKRVLSLKLNDLKASNDKMIQTIDSTKKVLKIKDKALQQAILNKTIINDTIRDTVILGTNCSFNITLKPNPETTSIIKLDSIGNITNILHIENSQILYVLEDKVYRNVYDEKRFKDFWKRLIRFDFKKDRIEKYEIVNSNDLIKTEETRVVKIRK